MNQQRANYLWNSYVGNQSVEEFARLSVREGLTRYQAVDNYIDAVPEMFGVPVADEDADLRDAMLELLSAYDWTSIRNQQAEER